jgi:hypothetical protein
MTHDDLRRLPPLPPGTPRRVRLSLAAIKFLQYHNRADVSMSFVAIWWGMMTLLMPQFWYGWPIAHQLDLMTGGFPMGISWALLTSGLGEYLCKKYKYKKLLTLFSLLGFVCWCLLTTAFLFVRPVFSPAIACYSAFAISKLASYVNHSIGIEDVKLPNPEYRGHD